MKFHIGDRVTLKTQPARIGTVRELFFTRVSVVWDDSASSTQRGKLMTHYKPENLLKNQTEKRK